MFLVRFCPRIVLFCGRGIGIDNQLNPIKVEWSVMLLGITGICNSSDCLGAEKENRLEGSKCRYRNRKRALCET